MKRTQKAQTKKTQQITTDVPPKPASSPASTNIQLDNFEFLQVVGRGAFGQVYKARVKQTNEIVAVKQILEDESMMNRETQILTMIGNHPNIINLRQNFYSNKQVLAIGNQTIPVSEHPPDKKILNLVTDFMPLTLAKYNQVSRDTLHVNEPSRVLKIKQMMFQLFSGLAHLHKLGISHRDIKPDNILVDSDGKNSSLKICDFGSAKILPNHNTDKLSQNRGSVTYISTRYYRGPELLYGNPYYGIEIDLWAAGCVLGEMFTKPQRKSQKQPEQKSYTLFRGESNIHQLALIISLKGSPTKQQLNQINPAYKQPPLPELKPQELESRLESGVPRDCVDLIEKLLCYVPSERITAEQALKHEFFADLIQSKSSSKATSASSHKRLRSEMNSATNGESSEQKTELLENTQLKRKKTTKADRIVAAKEKKN